MILQKQLRMKRLGKMKLLIVSACVVLGMSSCLKNEDSLSVYLQTPYLLQTDNETFIPQMRIVGSTNEALQSASLGLAGETFKFSKINDYILELPTNNIYTSFTELDSVPQSTYVVTITGVSGKTAELSSGFYATTHKVGTMEGATLEFNREKGEIQVEVADSVENATNYYLMLKVPTGSSLNAYAMWVPYEGLKLTAGEKLTATVSDVNKTRFAAGTTYRFAIGAGYGSVIRIGRNEIMVEIEE